MVTERTMFPEDPLHTVPFGPRATASIGPTARSAGRTLQSQPRFTTTTMYAQSSSSTSIVTQSSPMHASRSPSTPAPTSDFAFTFPTSLNLEGGSAGASGGSASGGVSSTGFFDVVLNSST